MGDVIEFPAKKTPVKDFLNKPMHAETVGDYLIVHTGSVVISTLVPLAIQGWILLIQRAKR